jgi:hypothetical protein
MVLNYPLAKSPHKFPVCNQICLIFVTFEFFFKDVWNEIKCWTLNILFVEIHKSSIKKFKEFFSCEKIQKIF